MARGGNRAQVRRLQRLVARACNSRQQERTARSARSAPAQPQQTRRLANSSRVMAVAPGSSSTGNVFTSLFGNVGRGEVRRARPDERYDGRIEQVNLDADRSSREARTTSGSGAVYTLATGRGKRGSMRVGSSRTVCVRLCDGFYFPINNRSHSDNFYDEHAMCIGRCPGADVSLYVHNNQSPVEGMRSTMTGEPYVNLPTAFVYRRKSVGDCSCRAGSVVAGLSAGEALEQAGFGSDAAEPKDGGTQTVANWQRFRAIYDETGQELTLFPKLGRTRGEPKSEDEPAEKPSLTPLPRGGPEGPPMPLALVAGDVGDEVRTIGPRAYTDTIVASTTDTRRRAARPAVAIRSTAITVVPLEPVTVDGNADQRAEAPGDAPGPSAYVVPKDDPSATLFAASNEAR